MLEFGILLLLAGCCYLVYRMVIKKVDRQSTDRPRRTGGRDHEEK